MKSFVEVKTEIKLVPTEVKTKSVVLTLSVQECAFLREVMLRIGGLPDTSLRKYANVFLCNLPGHSKEDCLSAITGNVSGASSIYFNDGTVNYLDDVVLSE